MKTIYELTTRNYESLSSDVKKLLLTNLMLKRLINETFVCSLLQFRNCNKEKNDTSSLVQIKVKNNKTKTNGVEIMFNIKP